VFAVTDGLAEPGVEALDGVGRVHDRAELDARSRTLRSRPVTHSVGQSPMVSKVSRHRLEGVQHRPQSTWSHHPGGRAANHWHAPTAQRPTSTSSSCPLATSAIETDHAWVRQAPCQAKSTSSGPTAVTCPIRSGSSTSAVR
jgi:hypothetical protein